MVCIKQQEMTLFEIFRLKVMSNVISFPAVVPCADHCRSCPNRDSFGMREGSFDGDTQPVFGGGTGTVSSGSRRAADKLHERLVCH
jgi:hypothetical protein